MKPRIDELKRWLYLNAKDGLTSDQALFLANKIRRDERLIYELSDVLKSDALPDSEIERFFREAIDAKNSGDIRRASRLADAIVESGRATDEQLAEFKRLDIDTLFVTIEIKRRAKKSAKRSNP